MWRTRKQTDKGQQYNLERMEHHFKALVAAWKRKSREGGDIIADATNSNELGEFRSLISETFQNPAAVVEDMERETAEV